MSKTHWQVESVEVTYTYKTLIFTVWLSVPTHTQSTNEHLVIRDWAAGTRSLPLALFRLWRHCQAFVRAAQAKPGPFDLNPTDYRGGILRLW